jgi:transposase
MHTRIIGVDLAVKAAHTAAIYDPASQTFLTKRMRFRSRPQEIERVLARARQGLSRDGRIVVILEATNMSWFEVGQYFHRQRAEVYRVNGRKTKALRQIDAPHAHSDKLDGMTLARLYLVGQDKLVRWTPPSGALLALQRMARELQRIVGQQTAIQQRLRDLTQWTWGGWAQLVPAPYRKWVMWNFYDPWTVTALGEAWLRVRLQEEMPHASTDWLAAWIARAEERKQLYAEPVVVDFDHVTQFIHRELEALHWLAQRRSALVKELFLPLYRQLFPDDVLVSLRGVGERSAAIYHGFIVTLQRFPNNKRFVQWTGMAPRSFQSGTVQHQRMRLSKQGPNLIKMTLYQNAQVARNWDIQLAQVYYDQMVNHGKHHTQAVCAVASHLASRIYAILRDQRPYELRDLQDHPISPKQARAYILEHLQVPEDIRKQRKRRQS